MKQSARIEIAKHTLAVLQNGYYINGKGEKTDVRDIQNKAEAGTSLYTPDDLDQLLNNLRGGVSEHSTVFDVNNETTLDSARRLAAQSNLDVLCLNFASAKNAGGGFMNGALAQEESIARASGLYPCLLRGRGYYEYHRSLKTCLYSDHMIYSPRVPVIKDEDGTLLDIPVRVSIITSPAVNAGVIERNEPENVAKIIPVMRKRVEKVLALSLHHHHKVLVLGAWGCGVFRNDPDVIARLFSEAFKGPFENKFGHVVFAVKTSNEAVIDPFRLRFK